MTFCHVDKHQDGSSSFALNYIRWDEINYPLERKYPAVHARIREFYARFYKAEGLIGQLSSGTLVMALEKCGYYPEIESKYYNIIED